MSSNDSKTPVTTGTGNKKPSLMQMANEALAQQRAGAAVANTAARAEGISDEGLKALQTKALADSELGNELMAIAKARSGVTKDPAAWRAFLSERLAFAAKEETPDPRKIVALMRGAMSRFMPEGEAAAYPLFINPPKGTERKWKPLFLSRVVRDKESGKLHNRGVMVIVPATGNDQDLRNLRSVRTKAAAEFVNELGSELLGNIRGKVWTACWLLPEATVYSQGEFDKFFERSSEEGLFSDKRRGGKYRYFKLSGDEIFVIKENGQAQRLVAALEALEERVRQYWAGELNIDEKVGGLLLAHYDEQISPDQFLRGMPGFAAVENQEWRLTAGKKKGNEASVTILLQRRDDGAWKCVICSINGAESLFGTNLRFHEWQDGEIPPHLQAFLNHGTQVEVTK